MSIAKYAIIVCLCAGIWGPLMARGGDNTVSSGPLFERFDLTLEPGQRTEVVSPFYYSEHTEEHHTWALPPLTLSYEEDPGVGNSEFDFAYPLLTYDRFGKEYRFQICEVFAFAGGGDQKGDEAGQFTLFPIYFQQRSPDPEENYTAFMPFYGTIRNRLFRDEIHVVMFPIYSKTRKGDVVTRNMPYPFFSLRDGDGLHGWKVWPFTGHEHKEVTTRTNGFNEPEMVPGHDSRFICWPFYLEGDDDIGTANPVHIQDLLPFYTLYRSKPRDSTTYFWPLGVTHTEDRGKQYEEWGAPWPLIVFDRGAGKHTDRVWPFYSVSTNQTLSSIWYLWPVYMYKAIHTPELLHERTRSLFFFYSDVKELNVATGGTMRRVDLWPLFTHRRDYNGNERLQLLSIIEPVLPASHKVERDYSHLYALYRSEKNPATGAASQSLLWNLYRHETAPERRKTSLLFGLFRYERGAAGRNWRICYIPFGKAPEPAPGAAAVQHN
jgi:hypothetical protein